MRREIGALAKARHSRNLMVAYRAAQAPRLTTGAFSHPGEF
jgi:hypothetical protein